jgi:hypothetical protein
LSGAARITDSITATSGAATMGNALYLEEIARPIPTPVNIDAPMLRRSYISIEPYRANRVNVVETGSTAKK